MANKSRRRMSEQERDDRRRAERERLQHAAEELLSSEGWARWVRIRASFHSYSASNCMLIALQCHQRGIEPQRVAGFRAWLKAGTVRSQRRGRDPDPPVTVNDRDPVTAAEKIEPRVFFKTTFVFDVSQTEPLPGADPASLEPPRQPLTGDSHAHLLAPLQAFAGSLVYAVAFEPIPGSAGGWCDTASKRIVVDADAPANARVRTLVHETIHALGVDYQRYTRAQAEVIVDTTTLIVLSAAGLDTSGETIPYVAGWGEHGALEAVTEFAHLIDTLGRRVANPPQTQLRKHRKERI